jgi:hypothetical protein
MTISIKTTRANGNGGSVSVESVADTLERELRTLIGEWFSRVEKEPGLTCIPLNYEERTGHLPRLMHDVNAITTGRRNESFDIRGCGRPWKIAA